MVADTALWRAITQLGAGQEIRGALYDPADAGRTWSGPDALLMRTGALCVRWFPSNLRRAWKLYESLQAEVEAARTEGSVAVDPAVYHALLFGVGLFYFLVSIVRACAAAAARGLGGR